MDGPYHFQQEGDGRRSTRVIYEALTVTGNGQNGCYTAISVFGELSEVERLANCQY